jgi:hypothetical protein
LSPTNCPSFTIFTDYGKKCCFPEKCPFCRKQKTEEKIFLLLSGISLKLFLFRRDSSLFKIFFFYFLSLPLLYKVFNDMISKREWIDLKFQLINTRKQNPKLLCLQNWKKYFIKTLVMSYYRANIGFSSSLFWDI